MFSKCFVPMKRREKNVLFFLAIIFGFSIVNYFGNRFSNVSYESRDEMEEFNSERILRLSQPGNEQSSSEAYIVETAETVAKTSKEIVWEIYEMLDILDKLFSKYHVNYWIDGGTLLAAVRHGGYIPWDDEANLFIKKSDVWIFNDSNFLKHVDRFDCEIFYRESFNIYKFFMKSGKPYEDPRYQFDYPYVDISVASSDGTTVKIESNYSDTLWPNCYHLEKDMYPLRWYKFGHLLLSGPYAPYNYLNRCYGNDWNTTAYHGKDHGKMQERTTEKFSLD